MDYELEIESQLRDENRRIAERDYGLRDGDRVLKDGVAGELQIGARNISVKLHVEDYNRHFGENVQDVEWVEVPLATAERLGHFWEQATGGITICLKSVQKVDVQNGG